MLALIDNFSIKLKEISKKQLSQDYFWGALQTAAKQGGSFLIFLLGTMLLSKESMGMYNYFMAIVVILVLFVDLGISTATSKYVAQYAATDQKKLRQVQFNALSLVLITAILIILLALWQGPGVLGTQFEGFVYFLPIVLFAPLASVLDGIYRGKRQFKKLSILTLTATALSVTLTFFLVNRLNFLGLALAQNSLYFLFTIFFLAGSLSGNEYKFNKSIVVEVFRYSVVFSLATLGYYLFSNINVIFIGRFEYFRELAYYELLNKAFLIPLMPFTILGLVIAPVFTSLYAKKEFAKVLEQYKKYLKRMLVAGALFAFATVFFVPLFVYVLARQYFDPFLFTLLPPLVFLYAQMAFSAPLTSGFIVATGHASITTYLNLFLGAVGASLSYFFVSRGMIVESIYALLGVHTFGLVVLMIIFYRRLKRIALDSGQKV